MGHRVETRTRESVAATTVFSRADIEDMGARNLWEVLQRVPGLTFVERDGAGRLPMVVSRGFFGGGETSYVILTVDGVPTNDTRTGVVEWGHVSMADVERIEVLRGSASVVYGDAALAAIVNIVTRTSSESPDLDLALSTGSWGDWGLSARGGRAVGAGTLDAQASLEFDRGYRERSESSRLASRVTYERRDGNEGSWRLTGSVSRLGNQEPGALTPNLLAADRRGRHPAFDRDTRTRWATEGGLGVDRGMGGGLLEINARLRRVSQDRVRTLLLTPSSGNTQLGDEHDWSLWVRSQYSTSATGKRLAVGAEGEAARYESRYCDPDGCGPGVLSEGAGRLWKGAMHAEAFLPIGERILLNGGVRFDVVRLVDRGPDPAPAPTFRQWSPRLAANFTYRRAADGGGRLFVSWTRAFKAPSLDQMYGARLIPSGNPDVTFNLSSADLLPQRSTAFELGGVQRIPLGAPTRHAEVSVSVYDQRLSDEIDFDIRTFKYGNILESRHRGVELEARIRISPRLDVSQSATLNSVTFRSGPLEGNDLKNVPNRVFVTTARLEFAPSARLSVTHRRMGGVYLDDENTQKLDGAGLIDSALRWGVGRSEVRIGVRNLLDTRYESLGYLLFDPATGGDVAMTFPGGGRFVWVGLSYGVGP